MIIIALILGILFVVGGFSCMFTPLATFLSTGYFLGIMLFIYGLMGILQAITNKDRHILGIITSILAFLVGVIAIVRPGSALQFDRLVLYLMAAWVALQGISSIVISIQCRKVKKSWVLGLIVGILGVLLALYSFSHPLFLAVTAGFLIGFFLLQAGLNLISLAVLGMKGGDTDGTVGE